LLGLWHRHGQAPGNISDVLDYVPGHFQVIRHPAEVRLQETRYDHPVSGSGDADPRRRARRPRLSKYSEHLPLYRQSEIYAQASGSVKSGSPEAFRYMTNRPQALSCSLADGRLKINNIAANPCASSNSD
jgi:transposase